MPLVKEGKAPNYGEGCHKVRVGAGTVAEKYICNWILLDYASHNLFTFVNNDLAGIYNILLHIVKKYPAPPH